MLDHLLVLKAVDGLIFLSNTKYSSIFFHLFYNFQFLQTSDSIDMDNRLVVCVYPMVNFVLDLSTYAYHQKDSKLVCFLFQPSQCMGKLFLSVLRKSGHEILESEMRALNSFPLMSTALTSFEVEILLSAILRLGKLMGPINCHLCQALGRPIM